MPTCVRFWSPFLALISPLSSAPSLSNETAFPNVARMVTSENITQTAVITLFKKFNFCHVTVLADDSVWARESFAIFRVLLGRMIPDSNITNAGNVFFNLAQFRNGTITAGSLLQRLPGADTNIVYLLTQPDVQWELFRQRSKLERLDKVDRRAWVSGWPTDVSLYDQWQTSALEARTLAFRGADGVLGFEVAATESTVTGPYTYAKIWAAQSERGVCTKANVSSQHGPFCQEHDPHELDKALAVRTVVDAVMMYAQAVDSLLAKRGLELNGSTVYKEILHLGTFHGMSGGRVVVNENGDRVKRLDLKNTRVTLAEPGRTCGERSRRSVVLSGVQGLHDRGRHALITEYVSMYSETVSVGSYDARNGKPDLDIHECSTGGETKINTSSATTRPLRWRGDTCDPPQGCPEAAASPAPSAKHGTGTAETLLLVLCVMCGLVVLALIGHRATRDALAYRRKHTPFNFRLSSIALPIDLDWLEDNEEGTAVGEPVLPQEIKRRDVRLLECIGDGNFGQVWKSKLTSDGIPGGRTAAAKILKGDTERGELLLEAMITAQASGGRYLPLFLPALLLAVVGPACG